MPVGRGGGGQAGERNRETIYKQLCSFLWGVVQYWHLRWSNQLTVSSPGEKNLSNQRIDTDSVLLCSCEFQDLLIQGLQVLIAPLTPMLLTPPPLPMGIFYSPQFHLHLEIKMAACRTQWLTSMIPTKNRRLWAVYMSNYTLILARDSSVCFG